MSEQLPPLGTVQDGHVRTQSGWRSVDDLNRQRGHVKAISNAAMTFAVIGALLCVSLAVVVTIVAFTGALLAAGVAIILNIVAKDRADACLAVVSWTPARTGGLIIALSLIDFLLFR